MIIWLFKEGKKIIIRTGEGERIEIRADRFAATRTVMALKGLIKKWIRGHD